jgi:hypothetical protein
MIDRYLKPVTHDPTPSVVELDLRQSYGEHGQRMYPEEGSAYAWSGLAYFLAGEPLQQAIESTTGPIVIGDLGSSFPVWPQVLRETHRKTCRNTARDVGDGVFNSFSIPAERRLRPMLRALVQDLLYHAPATLSRNDDKTYTLTNAFHKQLTQSVILNNRIFDGDELSRRPNYARLLQEKGIKPFGVELAEIMGEGRAEKLLPKLAEFLAWESLPHIRQFIVTSLDLKDPDTLRDEAQGSFPIDYTDSEFFFRTQQFFNHVRGDIFNPGYLDNTFTALTLFESYPLFFSGYPFEHPPTPPTQKNPFPPEPQSHCTVADRIAGMLKPGGKAIIFPWNILGENPHFLDQIVRRWSKNGMEIDVKEYRKRALKSQLSDIEHTFARRSRAFDNKGNTCSSLIVTKK